MMEREEAEETVHHKSCDGQKAELLLGQQKASVGGAERLEETGGAGGDAGHGCSFCARGGLEVREYHLLQP